MGAFSVHLDEEIRGPPRLVDLESLRFTDLVSLVQRGSGASQGEGIEGLSGRNLRVSG